MLRKLAAGILFAGLFALASAGASPDAWEILAKAKQAAGGDAWDAVRSVHIHGKLATGGLTGPAESWDDTLKGRFVDRFALGPISGAQGFDGETVWTQDSSKQVHKEEGGEEREAAADEAYRRSLAYWFPERWAALVEYSGEKEANGRRFHTLRITPKGGRPFDLWVDAATYLFDRTVEKADIETRTTFFSDYRAVNGLKVAFAVRSTNGEAKYDQFFTVEKIEFNLPAEEALFRMPEPPPPDFAFVGGKTSSTVPFELLNNHIYVQVKLNGKGSYRLLCDTGGANVVTPELAQELGLKPEGALQGRGVGEKSEDIGLVKVQTVQVGDASIANQVFAVFPMGSFASAEGVPQFGLIGYEVFKRFVVKVDYENNLLTFTAPTAFRHEGKGVAVPFQFNGHIPQVDGEIDGIPGKFDLDTGSRNSLSLLAPFVEKHGLKARYTPKVEGVTGWGVGGAARALVTRAKVLRLGSVQVENPVTELSLQKQGSFVSPYVAGNVGTGVLKRFNITFDYGRQQVIFERNANDSKPDTFDQSGMWLNQVAATLEVVDVVSGGPAAEAGIGVGDRILAIDGRNIEQLSLPEVRQKFRNAPPGTKVRLTVQSRDGKRDVVLVLRALV
jgi:hypothetical protein